jgi:hypothetical protein
MPMCGTDGTVCSLSKATRGCGALDLCAPEALCNGGKYTVDLRAASMRWSRVVVVVVRWF